MADQIDPGLIAALQQAFKYQAPQGQQQTAPNMSLWQAISGNSQGASPTPTPTPAPTPVDPYMNLANKATGKDYK